MFSVGNFNCFLRSMWTIDWDPATFLLGFEPAFMKWMTLLSGMSLLLCKASAIMRTVASNTLS